MALEIAQRAPAGYLGAQIFAGLMYVASALALVPVRAWKIRQGERIAVEKQRAATYGDADGEGEGSEEGYVPLERTGFVRAMFAFRRV